MAETGGVASGDSPFGGLYLAMETSGREASAALGVREGPHIEIIARTSLAAEEEHASLLIPRISELLEEVGADKEELEGVVVGAGPGSFTGVRVGAATAKGMASALGVPLWAFSSLGAAALTDGFGVQDPEARLDSLHPRCVLFDARGDRVYAAVYRVAQGTLETMVEPTAATLQEVLEGMVPPGSLLMGDGAVRHKDVLGGTGYPILPPPAGVPSAEGLIRLLALQPQAPPLADPGRWEPEYLRASGAERMWKTRKGM